MAKGPTYYQRGSSDVWDFIREQELNFHLGNAIKYICRAGYKDSKIEDLHKIAKALLTYETLTGEEIANIINKNKYPENKEDLKVEESKDSSALGSIGLKPKIVH